MDLRVVFLLSGVFLLPLATSEVSVISSPQPGQEYVFVHTSGSGARPISRKEKSTDAADRPFETAHKLPASLTFRQEDDGAVEGKLLVKGKAGVKEKREAKEPIAAPPGSIKIDPKKLIEKYRSELQSQSQTTTKAPTRATTTRRSRTKKEAPTTPSSVLTTGAPATPRTLQLKDSSGKEDKLKASGTENKRSRIQVKKGPNGQEYEYEYVYYYYDDDEEEGKDGKSKISNSHDGPQRNSIAPRGRSTTTSHPEPAANEVVPATRGTRQRGRQLSHDAPEEKVAEERLPQNTRFPPRGRNINTTPAASEEEEEPKRSRPRGRPQAVDSAADETQVNGRGRNRANVRRPSLDLVDSASFNTHSSNDPAGEYKEPKARGEHGKNSPSGPSFPSELPEGPVRFLGATPNEKMDLQDLKSRLADSEESSTNVESDSTVTTEETGTTEMSAMDKVALDLYAILQGTQKLSGESDEESSTELDSTTTTDSTTDETTTELLTTEEITTPTTTTTTTTTTPAPTTTTTAEPVTGRGRFRGRPGVGGNRFKSAPSSTTSAPEPSSEKPKGRFGRPGFGSRPRPGAKATTEASEPEATKEDSKPVSNARPTIGGRNRFGSRGRTPVSTTAAPEGSDSTTAASSTRSGLTRPRPGSFNLRRRGGPTTTTKEPADGSESAANETPEESASTTAKPIRSRVGGNLARPLRPGPRINLAARGRPGVPAISTTAAPEAAAEENIPEDAQAEEEKTDETTPLPNPITKLRNRPKLTVNARPKTSASAPVQVRRTNPLIARRKITASPEPSEAPTEAPQESSATELADEEGPSEAPSSTTEEPRGLNKLLAGRRRLVRPAQNH